MSKNTSVTLGDHFGAFVERQVTGGRYGSASEVIRAGLRLLEDHEARTHVLREALLAGEESGVSTPFDFDAIIARKRAETS